MTFHQSKHNLCEMRLSKQGYFRLRLVGRSGLSGRMSSQWFLASRVEQPRRLATVFQLGRCPRSCLMEIKSESFSVVRKRPKCVDGRAPGSVLPPE